MPHTQGGRHRPPVRNRIYLFSPSSQTILYEFRASDFICNKDGNLHGGAVPTIFDNMSSTALHTISRLVLGWIAVGLVSSTASQGDGGEVEV